MLLIRWDFTTTVYVDEQDNKLDSRLDILEALSKLNTNLQAKHTLYGQTIFDVVYPSYYIQEF
jgi:hypothetical protein